MNTPNRRSFVQSVGIFICSVFGLKNNATAKETPDSPIIKGEVTVLLMDSFRRIKGQSMMGMERTKIFRTYKVLAIVEETKTVTGFNSEGGMIVSFFKGDGKGNWTEQK